MPPKECSICAGTKSAGIICPKCQFFSCRTCVKTYIMGLKDVNPMCMSCKGIWDFEFVCANTEDSFENVYRTRRCQIILEREKSLLPATQPFVATIKKKRDLQEKLVELTLKIGKYRERIRTETVKRNRSDMKEEAKNNIEKYRKRVHKLSGKKEELIEELASLVVLKGENPEKPQPVKFIGGCPEKDCKGYLNENFSCGLCGKKVCPKCRQEEHENPGKGCDKNILETIKMLENDTKNCPSCKVPIYKISGCSQMWCCSCHTPFDWETGKIERGRIHNPHYYEWQRKNGQQRREPGDVRCGGQPDIYEIGLRLVSLGFSSETVDMVYVIHGLVGHIRAVIFPCFTDPEVTEETNRDLRMAYLLDKIDEKKWLYELKIREKRRERNRCMLHIFSMFCDTADDILANILLVDEEEISEVLVQLTELRKYANKHFTKLEKRLKNKIPTIGEMWDIRNCPRPDERRIEIE